MFGCLVSVMSRKRYLLFHITVVFCCLLLLSSRAAHRGGLEDSDDDSDGGGMFGFSGSDVEELLCQGIKPWDPEARAALMVLNGYADY